MVKSNSLLSGRIDDFACSLPLFEQIEALLWQRLEAAPGHKGFLTQLASCKRKQGHLDSACEKYSELAARFPNDLIYPYTVAALTGSLQGRGEVANQIFHPKPSPLVEYSDFLTEKAMQQIIDYMRQHRDDFRVVGSDKGGKYDEDYRNNTHLVLKGSFVEEMIRAQMIKCMSNITYRLGVSPFQPSRIEVKLRAYHNGEYFRLHEDGRKGRLISYTYFFHEEPKQFDGGELVIFDTDTLNSTYNDSFTRIIPKRNSVFFFPSSYYHAVLPVKTKNNDFMSARFVINGHIWGEELESNGAVARGL